MLLEMLAYIDRLFFLESETMTLIFFDIVWDFYVSGGSIIRYF